MAATTVTPHFQLLSSCCRTLTPYSFINLNACTTAVLLRRRRTTAPLLIREG
ncbi:hypothetical protein CASFOL_042449 [Castilleja foliolosa]|uniref:Uncharacterized protein n=1 Tax=Castilleja foliolosa TaxID=1961234 RepID=A0ABD3BAI8_9LAMI